MICGASSSALITVRASPDHFAVTMDSQESNRPARCSSPESSSAPRVEPLSAGRRSGIQSPRGVATTRSPPGVDAKVRTRSSADSHARAYAGSAGRRRGQMLTAAGPTYSRLASHAALPEQNGLLLQGNQLAVELPVGRSGLLRVHPLQPPLECCDLPYGG